MQEQSLIIFGAVWVLILLIAFTGFYFLSRIFSTLKLTSPENWESLGRPQIKVSLKNPSESEIKIPPNMSSLQFVWLFKTPLWAVKSKEFRGLFLGFRLIGFLSFIPAAGVLYIVLNEFSRV
ncbi:MAG: hypothetical protein WBC60_07335 [Cognaticolwellia sp.]|jgi:hypothetical protein